MKSILRRCSTRRAAIPLPALLACLWLQATPASAADLASALSRLDAGDYTAAIAELDELAGQGDPVAMTRLAALYQEGKGVSKDPTRAAMLYEQAAARGHADAQFNLGNMYLLGEGVPQDDDWAFTYYREAAKQGHAMAQKNVAEFYRAAGLTPPADEVTPRVASPEVLEPPAASTPDTAVVDSPGGPDAPVVAVDDEATKPYVPPPTPPPATYSQDELNAMQIARKHGIRIAESGSLPMMPPPVVVPRTPQATDDEPPTPRTATSNPGDLQAAKALIADGKPADAIPLLEAAASHGDAEAQFLLSQLLTTLSNGPDDNANALSWLQRAASGGYADAQFMLGTRYERGEGVLPDEAEAVTWYRAAARQGHPEAATRLRAIYQDAGIPLPDEILPRTPPRDGASAPMVAPDAPPANLTDSRQCPCIPHAYSSPAV